MSALIAGGIVAGLVALAKNLEGGSKATSPAPVAAGQSSDASAQASPDFAELQVANAYRQMVESNQTFHTSIPLPHATEATSPSAAPAPARISVGGHAVAVAPRPVPPRPRVPAPPRPVAPRPFAVSGPRVNTRTSAVAYAEKQVY